MKRISLIVAAGLALCGAAANAADSLTMADFGHKIKLQVNGYTGSETLTNFPVLVRIAEYDSLTDQGMPGFKYSDLTNRGGADLAFFDASGNQLASEIDTWNRNGESLVWVKIPQMAQGTQFYMCYNVNASGAWITNPNPWGDYIGVWHMSETGPSNQTHTVTISDSTENGLDGTTNAGNGVNANNGAVGRARKIAGDNNHAPGIIVDVKSDATKKAVADSLGTDFHASFWIRAQGTVSYSYMLGRRKGDFGRSWGVQFHEGDPPSKVRIFSGGEIKTDKDAFSAGEAALTDTGVGTTLAEKTSNPRTWKKVDVIWKDATNGGTPAYDFYINGAFVESKNLVFPVNLEENANIGIGCSTQDEYGGSPGTKKGRRLNGDMDEVRLRPGIVSADWIKAEYDTVKDADFVTPAPPEVVWANDSSDAPGVSDIHFDCVAFGGTVTGCDGFPSCSIQCKVWAADGTEPETWTTITNGLVAADAFSIIFPGVSPTVAYSYKLRAAGEDGAVGSTPVEGSFTTPAGFAVAWSSVTDARGLSEIHYDKVVVAGTVTMEQGLTTCEIQWKCWADGADEPESWTALTNMQGAAAFEIVAGELVDSTAYNYKLRAVADDGETTTPVVGTFTTEPGLTILWSGSAGIVQVGYDFIKIGGTVRALGDAASCCVQRKIWAADENEPEWTTFQTGLAKSASFTDVATELAAGTTYSYKLRACGDDGETTEVVEGTFTTRGEEGETIGSPYTRFFNDGTNSFWVAKEFERYLPFTVTGYTGTETLTNFPVLVEVRKNDANGFTYDDFYHYDGMDIAFVDEKGRIIPHEIDTWNKNGMSLFWVRLPEMNNGTTFTMCYRSPLLDPLPEVGNVFERYVGVWHMNEPDDGVVAIKDSTVNNLETESHAMSQANRNGRVGGARRVAQMPGSSSSYGHIVAFDHDDILRTGVGNVFTFSGWYKLAEAPAKWAYLVARKSEDADKGWGVQYDETDTTTELRVWSGSTAKNKFQIFHTSGMSSTDWNYWTFIYDGSVNQDGTTNQLFHAYLNGEELSSTVGGFHLSYPVVNDENANYDHLVIGGQQNGTGAFNGLVDECRYSKGMRSADWIKAEYSSSMQAAYWQDANRRFVTKGTVSRGTDSLVPVVVWENGARLPNTIVDVSYAYVQFAGTVTFCGAGATECRVEYKIWADGEEEPETWTTLLDHAIAGTVFSKPVTGLKQDMPYNFRIRAVNVVNGQERMNRERSGSFRTHGNITTADVEGELLRLDNRFVHIYRAGSYRFVAPDYATNVEMLVVGGGGAGGYKVGGGGGGGGVYYNEAFPIETGRVYQVQVGQGGIAPSNTTTHSSVGNGQFSYIARVEGENSETVLVIVPGGGGGGSFVNNTDVATGADNASGGGGTYAYMGGNPTDDGLYGHKGGRGNDQLEGGSKGKLSAGGGGGAGREGLSGTFDQWSAGGAGGVGIGTDISGEMLYFGAGGGGGYVYVADDKGNFTKPGTGGSGIGGNAADVRNDTMATSGVPNTGAGGGGGSSRAKSDGKTVDENFKTYWQGGNGGDGVVMISYEVHGRDPVSDEPRISMTSCEYNETTGYATITYRAYWAGIQSQLDDLYILYSKVSSNEVANGNGEWSKIATSAIGIGTTTFTPPEVGYTYWIRLVARKDANYYMYSDEIASFTLPAITLQNATWTKGNAPSNDVATINYHLFETNDITHLFCYWSESEDALKGDLPPSGDGVFLLDLGANAGQTLSSARSFRLSAVDRFARNKKYYFRLAAGDEQWIKFFLSDEIVSMDTSEIKNPSLHITRVEWANNIASLWFSGSVGNLDPAETEIIAIYSTASNKVSSTKPYPVPGDPGTEQFSLMLCTFHEDLETETYAALPLWSPVETNYYVRLVMSNTTATASESYIVPGTYSNVRSIHVTNPIGTNTLLYIVAAVPVTVCYGDDLVSTFGVYGPTYGGQTSGWGYENRWPNEWEGDQDCEVFAYTNSWPAPAGIYQISRGTLNIKGVQDKKHTEEGSEEEIIYQYKLEYIGGVYTITNAVFKTIIADVETNYTGEAVTTNALTITESGLRGGQHITYGYRVGGAGDWIPEPTVANAGNYTVLFKATAPNHDDMTGTFRVTIRPAELTATIGDISMNYTGEPMVPQVVTNVSGLVRGDINPLSCSFRDEAGEWQSAPPAFTSPGEYTLYFRVSAPNHTTFVTNCTVTVNGWDYWVNMDGAEGYQTPINVSDPGWLLRTTGKPSASFVDAQERYGNLDEVCPNGLKLWQNYVIERSELDKKLVATVLQRGSLVQGNSFAMHFPDIVALRNTGLAVSFRIDRKLKGESEFTKGALSSKYEGHIPLGPADPTGLYVFNMVLSPTNELYDGEAVLTSAATVGVLRVSSALTNTVVAVPWHSMSVESVANVDVSVSDVVNPHSVAPGDMIVSYNKTSSLFNAWSLSTQNVWDEIATVSTNGVTVEKADDAKLPRGNAFWLVRSNPSEYIYLVGRYTGDDYDIPIAGGTAANPGYTLFANPTMDEIDINDLVFEDDLGNVVQPSTNNFITVQTAGGINRTYVRHRTKNEWGCDLPERKGRRIEYKWTPGGKIPPGTGCWFTRKESGGLNIKLRAKGE